MADIIFPAAEIASNVPDAVRVFGDGPNTLTNGSRSVRVSRSHKILTFVKNKARTSGELMSSSVEQAANLRYS